MNYVLKHQHHVQVSATGSYRFIPQDSVIDKYDVLGILVTSNITSICTEASTSTQPIFLFNIDSRMSTDDLISLTNAHEVISTYVCHVQVIIAADIFVQPPGNIINPHFLREGLFRFGATLTNELSNDQVSLHINLLYSIRGFALQLPPNPPNLLVVEDAVETHFVWSIVRGSSAVFEWSLNDITKTFRPNMCASVRPLLADCMQFHMYVLLSETFHYNTNDNFNIRMRSSVNNSLSRSQEQFDIQVQQRIRELLILGPDSMIWNTSGNEQTAPFTATISSGTHVQWHWDISGSSVTSVEDNISYAFSSPGSYVISVSASNGLNDMNFTKEFGLYVVANPTNLMLVTNNLLEERVVIELQINVEVSLHSSIALVINFGDTDEWNLQELGFQESTTVHMTLEHQYYTSGDYTITVLVIDLVINSIPDGTPDLESPSYVVATRNVTVLEAVDGLSLSLPDGTSYAVNETFLVRYELQFGSPPLLYTWHFDDVIVEFEGTWEWSYLFTDIGVEEYQFSEEGEHTIALHASNAVSEVSAVISVIIDLPLDTFEFTIPNITTVGTDFPITYEVTGGSNVQVTYTFQSETGIRQEIFPESHEITHSIFESGIYTVTGSASNGANSINSSRLIYNLNEHSLYILGISVPDCIETGVEQEFSVDIVIMLSSSVDFRWNFGDGSSPVENTMQTIRHTFNIEGTFALSLMATLADTTRYIEKTVCVQIAISNVEITSESSIILPPGGTSILTAFCDVGSGSGFAITWFVNEERVIVSELHHQLEYLVAREGAYNIMVEVENNVNLVEESTLVHARYIITDPTLTHSGQFNDHLILGATYIFSIQSTATIDTYQWVFPEGWEIVVNQGATITVVPNVTGSGPVSVGVSNYVSDDVTSKDINVQEQISGVSLVSSANGPVLQNDPITFTASSDSGTELLYAWKICDECEFISHDAVYTYAYINSGTYTITVLVSNSVSTGSSSVTLDVIARISGLSINIIDPVNGTYISLGQEISLTGTVDQGYPVSYAWNINHISTLIAEGNQDIITFVPANTGQYLVSLQTRNSVSDLNTSIVLYSLEPVNGLEIIPIDGVYSTVGSSLRFQCSRSHGTNATYLWLLMDYYENVLLRFMDTDQIEITLPSLGVYNLEITSANAISKQVVSLQINIQASLPNSIILINMSDITYVSTLYSVLISTDITCHDCTYLWNIDRQDLSDHSSAVWQHFQSASSIPIAVTTSNQVSETSATKELIIEEVIGGLTVTTTQESVEIGENLELSSVLITGTPVSYRWTINDVEQLESTNGNINIEFIYEGEWNITLYAFNHISSATYTKHIPVGNNIQNLTITGSTMVAIDSENTWVSSVDSGNAIIYHWYLRDINGELVHTEMGSDLTYKIRSNGIFSLTLTARNLVSYAEDNTTVTVQIPVKNVEVLGIRSAEINASGEYIVTVQEGSDMLYKWKYNSDPPEITESNINYFIFPDNKRHRITVTVFNNVSSEEHPRFTVYVEGTIPCETPIISNIGPYNRKELRSMMISLSMDIDYVGCRGVHTSYEWTVYKGSCHNSSHWQPIKPKGSSLDVPHLNILPRALHYGDYCVRFQMIYDRTPVGNIINAYCLSVIPSDLIAIIEGGTLVTASVYDENTLDGSKSYDPDQPDWNRNLIYAWDCFVKVSKIRG